MNDTARSIVRHAVAVSLLLPAAPIASYAYGFIRTRGEIGWGLVTAALTVAAISVIAWSRVVVKVFKGWNLHAWHVVLVILAASGPTEAVLSVYEVGPNLITYAVGPGKTFCRKYSLRPRPWSDCYTWHLPGSGLTGAKCDAEAAAAIRSGNAPAADQKEATFCYTFPPMDSNAVQRIKDRLPVFTMKGPPSG